MRKEQAFANEKYRVKGHLQELCLLGKMEACVLDADKGKPVGHGSREEPMRQPGLVVSKDCIASAAGKPTCTVSCGKKKLAIVDRGLNDGSDVK